jgi:hypothetical protein
MKTKDFSEQDALGCILFFDSLKSHNKFRVRDNIIRWLNSEWDRLAKFEDPSEPMPFTSRTFPIFTPEGTVMLKQKGYLSEFLQLSLTLLLALYTWHSSVSNKRLRLWGVC